MIPFPSRLARFALCLIIFGFAASCMWVLNRPNPDSKSTSLFGEEVALKLIYGSDLSDRGRELGGYFKVYELPSNLRESLVNNGTILSKFPKTWSLGSDYQCIKWTDNLLDNEIGAAIYEVFEIEQDFTPQSLGSVTTDLEAAQLATHLVTAGDGVFFGGWCKSRKRNQGNAVRVIDAYLYIWDTKDNKLIMFGLDT